MPSLSLRLRSLLPGPAHRARLVACLLAAVLPGALRLAAAQILQSQQTGYIAYPDNSPSSIGNESNVSFSATQTAPGPAPAVTSLAETRSGVDFNNTTGTVSIAGTTTANYGVLASSNQVQASSVAFPYPHGQGLSDGLATFEDYISLWNPNYGGVIPVTLHVSLNWNYGYTDVAGGSNSATNWAIAQAGIDWFGSLTLYNLQQHAGSYYHEELDFSQSLSGFAANAATVRLFGSLSVRSTAGLNSQGTVGAPYGEILAHSDAIAEFYLEVPTGTIITSLSGHDYSQPGVPAAVPEASALATVALAAASLVGLASTRRRMAA